jgi:3-oxoacyl-(acyl-carrier-protein) synthase
LAGWGASNYATHLASPDASGIEAALRAALADAQLDVGDVDLLNAHGAGTRVGDVAEIAALRRVFAERLPHVAITSSKGALGHWQGAAGVVEALACVLSLSRREVAPTHGAEPVDPAWPDLDIVLARRPARLRAAVSISSGLGGINTAAVFACSR